MYGNVTVQMTLLIKACPHCERLVILSEAKNPVRFLAKLTGFFVASLLRMTEPKGHLNCNIETPVTDV